MSKADNSKNHILRCLGIEPNEATADDERLALVLEERIGEWRYGPAYVEEARKIMGRNRQR